MDLGEKLHYDLQSLGEFQVSFMARDFAKRDMLQSAKVVIGDLDADGAEHVMVTIRKNGG